MANEQNLKTLTPNEAREFGRQGGIVSGQVRRERKKLREMVLAIANCPLQFEYESERRHFVKRYSIENPTILDSIMVALLQKASYGDMQAIKILFSLIEDKTTQITQFTNSNVGTNQQKTKVSFKEKHQQIN